MKLQPSVWFLSKDVFRIANEIFLNQRLIRDMPCRVFSLTHADMIYLPVYFLSAQRAGTYTASVNRNESWFPISPLLSPILAASTPT